MSACAAAAIRSGSCAGSCERSASIWQMTSTGSPSACFMPSMYERPKPRFVRAVQHRHAPSDSRAPAPRRPRRCRRATVVDDQDADAGCCIRPSTSTGRFVALVVGRDDDERRLRSRPPPFEPQRRNLLGDQADQEDHDAQQDQQHRRIGDVRLRGDRPRPRRPAPTAKARALIGTKIRSGLKIVITFSRISKKRAPSEPSRIFDDALPLRGLDRLEPHAVARPDERQRRRRRRREAVREQVDELQQAVAPRGAEARREIRDRLSGEVTGDPVQQRVAGAPRRGGLRVAATARRRPDRSREVRHQPRASAGWCWPSASTIRM